MADSKSTDRYTLNPDELTQVAGGMSSAFTHTGEANFFDAAGTRVNAAVVTGEASDKLTTAKSSILAKIQQTFGMLQRSTYAMYRIRSMHNVTAELTYSDYTRVDKQ